MKAGTAQKMVLNMLSTATMIRLGRVYGNLLSNLQPKNDKLRRPAVGILMEGSGAGAEEAAAAFEKSGDDVRIALLMLRHGMDRRAAERLIESNRGSLRRALDSLR